MKPAPPCENNWLLQADHLRAIEQLAGAKPLMALAGEAAAAWAEALRADDPRPVLVLVGPGNNGGDAIVAAHWLWARGHAVVTVFVGDRRKLPTDARAAHEQYAAAKAPTPIKAVPADREWSLIIDGLFGIGLSRPITGAAAAIIGAANNYAKENRVPLLALDCPSGLNADTGIATGPVIVASHTLSFICGKPGLVTADGPDHCGELRVNGLGLDLAQMLEKLPACSGAPPGRTIRLEQFFTQLGPRRRNSHKGTFGSAGIIGGSPGMTGAALLAGRAALAAGSGRVYVGIADSRISVDYGQPELMLRSPEELTTAPLTALACGPGMGLQGNARRWLDQAVECAVPLLLDADALSLLAAAGPSVCTARGAPTTLTPHPAEAARLLGRSADAVQHDRIAAALELASRYRATVVLKGCGTVVADPDATWSIDTQGTPALASAGTGDVLTGFITALLAQGWPAALAARAGVHLHSRAGAETSRRLGGHCGVCASDLIDTAPRVLNAWHAVPR